MGALEEAARSYRRALSLVSNESERRYLERRLKALEDGHKDLSS
jgi:RNA polymerase sigma-70 factor (ECF subfamily)